ncbi:gamma-butyrobetaine hydroxylase-like domain-containing protein [Pyruvatibacter mobilis]|uniref:gamma-butyrobetaine hydroxylase-like domain-containing protein n=1 Tax=Pyruvatibacter mobilis TaxID=1712261 RepID=UPI003BA91808
MSGTGQSGARPWPTDISLKKSERTLTVTFDDGAMFTLPAELLRVESPSAEVQGHGAGQKKTVPGKRNVAITNVEPVGTYALRIIFSDGHDSGLFTWDYLYELGRDADAKMHAYLLDLKAKGLSRD